MKAILLHPVTWILMATLALLLAVLGGTTPEKRAEILETVIPEAVLEVVKEEAVEEDVVAAEPVQAMEIEEEKETSLDSEAEKQFIAAQLEGLERIRNLPGAAPLLDEVIAYIQREGIHVENLPTDENGVATLDENSLSYLIPDEQVRESWMKLTAIIASRP
jgi:hypothetical protein